MLLLFDLGTDCAVCLADQGYSLKLQRTHLCVRGKVSVQVGLGTSPHTGGLMR